MVAVGGVGDQAEIGAREAVGAESEQLADRRGADTREALDTRRCTRLSATATWPP